jgi:hypothetical protein
MLNNVSRSLRVIANSRPMSAIAVLLLIGTCVFLYNWIVHKPVNEGDYTNYTPYFDLSTRARIIQTEVNGTKLWDQKAAYHGLTPNLLPKYYYSDKTCNNFFASWPGDCVDKEDELNDRLKLFSAQMVVMNTTLTLYVTSMKGCQFSYPNILVEVFDKTEILKSYGFEDAFPKMDTWVKTRYTRISDILRLALAHRFQKSYVDTDVHFLELSRELYEVPYVGVGVYSDLKNALEITNAAFCLPRDVLHDMLAYQKNRIVKGSDKYFYTELGPSMFHKVQSMCWIYLVPCNSHFVCLFRF